MCTNRVPSATVAGLMIWVAAMAPGCASTPAPTGFLSDYSRLEMVKAGWMRYISPKLAEYSGFMIDPVQIRVEREALDAEKRAEVARYMRDAIVRVLDENDYAVVTQSGTRTARLRVAITDIQESKWYLNIHPATKLTGVGKGGASMEAEVIDSVTGEQLAATIRRGQGKQFELSPFSTIDDVKAVIDKWAEAAGERLQELKQARAERPAR
jgi:phenylpyruvate tautomerase PptA (4-oxalocrotonate tautomerase family)